MSERTIVTDQSQAFLAVDRLSKRYGDIAAIDDMSLAIPRGEFLTLLGPSGSGKTTLLMAIAGFVTPSAGSIRLEGREIGGLPPEKRDLGVVFQGYALFPHMTVAENIAFPLEVRRLPRAEIDRLVAAALDTVQLGQHAARRPAQLSGGQQQRVALARALVFSPPLILLDEPLSALDKQLRGQLQEELKSLHRRLGATFINVTHDQDEALSMSTLIAVVNHGRIVQVGTPLDVYERPRTVFVANFVGRSNIVEAEIKGGEGDGRIALAAAGTTLISSNPAGQAAGTKIAVSLRPEKLTVGLGDAEGPNRIRGTIADYTYHGNSTQLVVATPLGALRVEEQTWRIGFPLANGLAVSLSWAEDAPVIVAPDQAA
ncbi:ABC transporter ATP-binding protein [Phreatobacter stygius]|uniref:ABC transporter ATP-binding protein n=1 Tax=Phreatobacter stygius TaxID=1940610 RepID=A0A4D7B7M2_9HYPH|nr:ABC transporter ATP-binding protein [Phreatobacter stygius]QCI66338.1 ABC transporter ATP-binding protein [Phreatobacter stygius]